MRYLILFLLMFEMLNTAHGQTFMDIDTGEMLVIDSQDNDLFGSSDKVIKHLYYANHTARFISMKVIECKYESLPPANDIPGTLIKAVFPNDPSKVYRLKITIACGTTLTCTNPDGTQQLFTAVSDNRKPQGNAIEHIRENWSGDFCYFDPKHKHPEEKISIDLNTRPFKATYYGSDKTKPIPLLMSDINTKDFTFTLAFSAKPKEIYRCKITSVDFYAVFELINPNGRKQKFSKMDCLGWEK
jgi:hypothetical protein